MRFSDLIRPELAQEAQYIRTAISMLSFGCEDQDIEEQLRGAGCAQAIGVLDCARVLYAIEAIPTPKEHVG